MAIQIVHASISENGNAGWDGKAKAGDQTGKELCIRSWYNKGWTVMLRYPDANVRKKAVSNAKKIANSNLTGYDQSQRNSLYQALKKNGFDVDKYIKSGEKTETDCSEFMYACYANEVPKMRSDENAPSTHNWESGMRAKFKSWGFEVHTESKYLTTDEYLLEGDILVYEGHHTVMAAGNGAKAITTSSTSQTTTSTPTSSTTYSTGIYKVNETLNVRGGAGTTYAILGTAKAGETYTVAEVKNTKWGKITFNGKEGYISLAYATKTGDLPKPTTTTATGNALIKKGQEAAVKFTGLKAIDGKTFDVDGERGPQTRKMAACVLQTAMNKDYKCGLTVDGVFGATSKTKLAGHYVEKGETQWMVTAAEIMLYMLGKDPNGIEYPGEFGSGLAKAAGKTKITANDFLEYLN